MRYLVPGIILFFLAACSGGDINQVKVGMSQEEVVKIMGNPDDVMNLNMPDSTGNEMQVTIWQYGSNQGILLRGGNVYQVIPDVDKVFRDFQNSMEE